MVCADGTGITVLQGAVQSAHFGSMVELHKETLSADPDQKFARPWKIDLANKDGGLKVKSMMTEAVLFSMVAIGLVFQKSATK